MRKIVLLLMTNLTLLLANADLKTDLDHDGKLDKVYFEEKKESVYLVCELSSQNFKKVRSQDIGEFIGRLDQVSLTKKGRGFEYSVDFMRAGYTRQFRYEPKSKKIQLIGVSSYAYGNAANDGSGESSYNLLTNRYIGNFNYWSLLEDKLIKMHTIENRTKYPKIYLENFVSFEFDDSGFYEEMRREDIQKKENRYFKTLIAKKFPNYKVLEYKDVKINQYGLKDRVVVLESKKKGKPYSELDDGYGRKVVLIRMYADGFEILAQNDHVVGCTTCGGSTGDPYRGITVKHNYILFEELYGACVKDYQVTTFKYNAEKEKWYLHKLGVESTFCNEEENGEPKVERKIKTVNDFGVVEFSEFEDGLR